MLDYSFDYKGDSYKIPKNKIFECLYSMGEISPIATLGDVFSSNDFMKAAKLFCVMGDYCKKDFDPLEVTKHYLYEDGGAAEIFTSIGGLVALLNPPETYHPPETEEAGK